jgi:hypothetical protein
MPKENFTPALLAPSPSPPKAYVSIPSLNFQPISNSFQHAPGVKVGNDAAPEFSAQTLPAGTAPAERTFKPNTESEIPGQAMNPNIAKETWTSAQDTIGGATSADVHQGYGHPGSGQTSNELKADGRKNRSGLEGVGGDPSQGYVPKGAERDHELGPRSDRENLMGAEDRLPAGAEEVASERP